MKTSCTFLFVLVSLVAQAQRETFDIVHYQVPAGWTKETTDYAVSFLKVNNTAGTWCRMVVYKSISSSGVPATDFSNEWKAIVKQDTYAGAVQPVPTESVIDGWTQNVGQSRFRFDNKDGELIFYTLTGHGREVTIFVSMNSREFFQDISDFITTLNLDAPAPVVQQPAIEPATQPVAPAASIQVSDAPGISGINVSTTNFNDGWVAQPFADYVKVTRPTATVLLHYSVEINDEMRRANNMAEYFWNRMIVSRYRVASFRLFEDEPFTYFKTYFAEGQAADATGKPCYVALRVLVNNGIARCIEIITPNEGEFRKLFPDHDKVAAMTGYNKFLVSASDLAGQWDESTSSAVQLYSTVTGNYAGMNMSASANSFTFGTDGNYTSHHSGAFGMVGSTTVYDQKYKGTFTLNNWEITMTNRFEGKTDVYYLQYEAVRGGRLLHMNGKESSGLRYALVKVK